MSYLVIAYPKVSDADFEWIQDVRVEYDLKQFRVVKPHITLVFGTQKLEPGALIAHVRTKVADVRPFTVKLDSAKVIEDDSAKYFHAFLVPSNGFKEINRIHDLLYTDGLASELRLDIPFMPHLGIGNNSDKKIMDELTANVNLSGKSIEGKIEELTVVEFDGNKVTDISRVSLSQLQ
jgi:2'-5' RNA ligase